MPDTRLGLIFSLSSGSSLWQISSFRTKTRCKYIQAQDRRYRGRPNSARMHFLSICNSLDTLTLSLLFYIVTRQETSTGCCCAEWRQDQRYAPWYGWPPCAFPTWRTRWGRGGFWLNTLGRWWCCAGALRLDTALLIHLLSESRLLSGICHVICSCILRTIRKMVWFPSRIIFSDSNHLIRPRLTWRCFEFIKMLLYKHWSWRCWFPGNVASILTVQFLGPAGLTSRLLDIDKMSCI